VALSLRLIRTFTISHYYKCLEVRLSNQDVAATCVISQYNMISLNDKRNYTSLLIIYKILAVLEIDALS